MKLISFNLSHLPPVPTNFFVIDPKSWPNRPKYENKSWFVDKQCMSLHYWQVSCLILISGLDAFCLLVDSSLYAWLVHFWDTFAALTPKPKIISPENILFHSGVSDVEAIYNAILFVRRLHTFSICCNFAMKRRGFLTSLNQIFRPTWVDGAL